MLKQEGICENIGSKTMSSIIESQRNPRYPVNLWMVYSCTRVRRKHYIVGTTEVTKQEKASTENIESPATYLFERGRVAEVRHAALVAVRVGVAVLESELGVGAAVSHLVEDEVQVAVSVHQARHLPQALGGERVRPHLGGRRGNGGLCRCHLRRRCRVGDAGMLYARALTPMDHRVYRRDDILAAREHHV